MKIQKGMISKAYLVPVLAVCLLAVVVLVIIENGEKKKIAWPTEGRPVKTERVLPAPQLKTRSFPAIAQATREVELAFRVGGPLQELPVDVGQFVDKGQLIAGIDPRDFRVRIKNLEAQLAAFKAERTDAALQYKRYKNLYATNAVPKAEYDHARAAFDRADARVAATAQELQNARNALADTRLLAPFSGYVHRKHVENNDNVRAKQPIVTFLDCSVMEVSAGIPEELVADTVRLQGFACAFDVYPDLLLEAQLKELGRKSRLSNQTYPLTVTLGQPESVRIRPGMAATLLVRFRPGQVRPRMLIASAAVVNDRDNRSYVWVYNPEAETVTRRLITTGALCSDGIEVTDGLKEGELIVSAGAPFLHEGQKVNALSSDWKQMQHTRRPGDLQQPGRP